MKDQKNLAVCVVVDAKFLFKYFKNFINSLELKGKYKGDIVVITSWFTPTFLRPSLYEYLLIFINDA